jgi:hypothetical protein
VRAHIEILGERRGKRRDGHDAGSHGCQNFCLHLYSRVPGDAGQKKSTTLRQEKEKITDQIRRAPDLSSLFGRAFCLFCMSGLRL